MKANLIQIVFFRSAESREPFERSLGRNAVILERVCDLPWALPPGTNIRLTEGLVVRVESIELDLSSGWLKVELVPTTRTNDEDFEAAWKEYEAAGFKRVAGPEDEPFPNAEERVRGWSAGEPDDLPNPMDEAKTHKYCKDDPGRQVAFNEGARWAERMLTGRVDKPSEGG